MQDVEIKTKTIGLGQFLKWADIVESGGEAKALILSGNIKVNGSIEKRRSTALKPGDVVKIRDSIYRVSKK